MSASGGLAKTARMVPYAARYLASAYPTIYMPYARRHYPGTGVTVVGPDTSLVIEGFGRSGSTFAVDAFEMVQKRPVPIAHHTHAAAQVIAAAKMDLPILLLVRDPIGATLSHMARRGIGPRLPLMAWILYHRRVLPYRDRMVVGGTAELSTGIGDMTRRVNDMFRTNFDVFEPTAESVAMVFEMIERRNRERYGGATVSLARPTAEREARKRELRHHLESPGLARLLVRAQELFCVLIPPGPTRT